MNGQKLTFTKGKMKSANLKSLQKEFGKASEDFLERALYFAENNTEYQKEIVACKASLLDFLTSSYDPQLANKAFTQAKKTKLDLLNVGKVPLHQKVQDNKNYNEKMPKLKRIFSKETQSERHDRIRLERQNECSKFIESLNLLDLGHLHHPNDFFKIHLNDLASKFTWFLEKEMGRIFYTELTPFYESLRALWVPLIERREDFESEERWSESGEKFQISRETNLVDLLDVSKVSFSLNSDNYNFHIFNILSNDQVTSIEYLKGRLQKIKQRSRDLNLQALARESTEAQRNVSGALRTRQEYEQQIKIFSGCPYCYKSLGEYSGDGASHFDHIHPVSKGGLSTPQNMIFVCARCNRKKSDQTLNKFIEKFNLNRDQIIRALRLLNKDY